MLEQVAHVMSDVWLKLQHILLGKDMGHDFPLTSVFWTRTRIEEATLHRDKRVIEI